jgi:hypothetical protein
MTTFVLRTSDQDWIARNGGTVDNDGKVTVQMPDVERVTFAGRSWLRHTFRDIPADALNAGIMCPLAWVS